MNRRSFFAVLAGLPFVGKLLPAQSPAFDQWNATTLAAINRVGLAENLFAQDPMMEYFSRMAEISGGRHIYEPIIYNIEAPKP